MLLSLMMCLSLMMIPAQATSVPDPDDPIIIINVSGDPADPGNDDPDGSECPVQSTRQLPDPAEEHPVD